MGSLQFNHEQEEYHFFDARECSVSSAPYTDFGLSSNFNFDVWSETPQSVQQRRKEFLIQMGFESDGSVQEDIDRIAKNSGTMLRISTVDHESSSSLLSSSYNNDLCTSHESNSDFCEIENLSGEANCSENELENEKDGMRVKRKKISIKKKLLNRLSSIKSIVYKKGESEKFSPVKGVEGSERVKVRYCGKQLKELSALFKGQDIPAHTGLILCMKFSLDGRYLATGGDDGVVRVWKVVVDTRLSEINPSNFDPSCVYLRVNDHSQLLPLISKKEKLVKFRKRTVDSACVVLPPVIFRILEEPIHEFHGHGDEILDLSWSKHNYLLSASTDNTVRMWQVGCESRLKVFQHNNFVTCVQFNPRDESRFVSGSIDGKVRIWDINSSQVVGWTYIKEIVTAVCYRPNGQGLIVGSIEGACRFYSTEDDLFQLEAQVDLHGKKKAQCKRITGFQFFPDDHDKLMVTSTCSQVKILRGIDVIGKFKGNRRSGNQILASFTPDGKHILSTSNDSNIYLWNCIDHNELSQPHPKKSSWERFSANAYVAIPWFGFKSPNFNSIQIFAQDEKRNDIVSQASPSRFSLGEEIVFELPTKGTATWPEEKLRCTFMGKSDYKFFKNCQNKSGPHAWNMVIVAAGRDGRIRSFHNYGLPIIL